MGKPATIVNLKSLNTNEYKLKNVTLQEIADIYNISKSTVENYYHQGKLFRGYQIISVKEDEQILSDKEIYFLDFTKRWDEARFLVNPSARKGVRHEEKKF